MNTTAIALVLASALMHALRDFLTKRSRDKQIFVWMFLSCAIILFLPIPIYFLLIGEWFSFQQFLLIVISASIHALYAYMLTKTYDHGDLSHTYPIVRSAPAVVLLVAILFSLETVSFIGVVGIILVVLGAYIVCMKQWKLCELFGPLFAMQEEKASQFALLTMLIVATYSLYDKYIVGIINPVLFNYVGFFTLWLLLTPYIFTSKHKADIWRVWRHEKRSILLNSCFDFLSYGFILVAFTYAQASYVVGLRQISVVFAVLLGGHVLREKNRNIRLLGALTIFGGSLVITIA